jgi:hypothetical protein
MEWLQAFMIAGSTLGACYFMHRENLKDRKEHNKEMRDIANFSANEAKDFHGRLCTLEERYLQMMQRILEGKKGKDK